MVHHSATETTTRCCRDPETAVINFWSPGVRGRPQRVPSAASAADAAAVAQLPLVLQDLSGKSVTVRLWRMLSRIMHTHTPRMCMQSFATIGYDIKKP